MALRIGFIGAGRMAKALANGMVAAGKVNPVECIASSPKADLMPNREEFVKMGIAVTHDNQEVVARSDAVFVCVKPSQVKRVLAEIAPSIDRSKLTISVALGVTIKAIEEKLPQKSRVIRGIPNTPVLVRAGTTAFSVGHYCEPGDAQLVQDLFTSVGFAVQVNEQLVDAVTGLASCGPSYMFCAIESLADGGVKMGIPRELALKLAAHTLLGAGRMVLDSGKHPAQLKDDVQSPSGSSIYAMHALELSAFRGTLMTAVQVATERSRSTGKTAYFEED